MSIPFLLGLLDGSRNYLVTYNHGYHSVDDYLARSDMAENGVWGRDFEMCMLDDACCIHTLWLITSG